VVGASLTPEVAARYAAAFAAALPSGPIVIGRDGRESGPMLAAAIIARLCEVGRDVIDCGVAATPTVGIAVREHAAAAGIQISASHNPARYNGMKLFAAEGRVLTAEAGRGVLAAYQRSEPEQTGGRPSRGSVSQADPTAAHVGLVASVVDVAAIRRHRPRVWIDCGHGAGSRVALPLLDQLGCEVVAVGAEPDGRFEHEPEPTAENLAGLLPQIAAAGADVGFFQDPDADRLAIADASGRYLGEEATLALCVEAVLAKTPGPVVVNCSTSGMTAAFAARRGLPCHTSAVGEANVVDAMLAQAAVLGGEGNGGVIDPRVVLVRDSAVALALVLERMCTAERLVPVAELAAGHPRSRPRGRHRADRRGVPSGSLKPARRPQARLAGWLAARAGEQHRADRAIGGRTGGRCRWRGGGPGGARRGDRAGCGRPGIRPRSPTAPWLTRRGG